MAAKASVFIPESPERSLNSKIQFFFNRSLDDRLTRPEKTIQTRHDRMMVLTLKIY